jgi:hypothetical protein
VNFSPPVRALALTLPLTIIICCGVGIAGASPQKRPLALATPSSSGLCGLCADAICSGPQGRFRCVRLFDPQQGTVIRSLTCDPAGHFRADLPPGHYVLNRSGLGYPLKNVKDGHAVEVKKDEWTRLDGLSETDCPNSGIYGLDNAPCWGNPPTAGAYECVKVLDARTRKTVATGQCDMASPVFNVPLAPGRYVVKSASWPEQTVDIEPGRWIRLGVTEAPPCPPVP